MHNIDYNVFRYQRHCVSNASSSASSSEKRDILTKYPDVEFNEFKHRKILFDDTLRLRRIHDPTPVVLYQPPASPRKKTSRKKTIAGIHGALSKFRPLHPS